MEKFEELYSDNKEYILFFILLIIIVASIGTVAYYFSNSLMEMKKELKQENKTVLQKEEKDSSTVIVDIKGEVQRSGVYEIEQGKRVIDVINKAGGLSSNADTSVNNLSMKVQDEMVIIIYSKKEIADYVNTKKKEEQKIEKCAKDVVQNNSCIKEESKSNSSANNSSKTETKTDNKKEETINKKVSINSASKEELMTLTGIGEAKANSIIEYRKTKKFENIEELKQVSGIGDSIFEKIKDNITI